jgi:hypothetical protein
MIGSGALPEREPLAPARLPPGRTRRFGRLRIALGLVLAAAAAAALLARAPERLDVSCRIEPSPAAGSPPAGVVALPAGGTATLCLEVKPGPDLAAGTRLVCDERSRPTVRIAAPEGIVFFRADEFLHEPDEVLRVPFCVSAGARPGLHLITVEAAAELSRPDSAVLSRAAGRVQVPLDVVPAAPAAPAAGQQETPP